MAGRLVNLSLGGLTWKELLRETYRKTNDDDLLGRAAQLSYYFLLALFPLLLFLTTLLGYFAASRNLRRGLISYLGQVLPRDAVSLVSNTLNEITTNAGGGKLSFGLLAALWAASSGMTAISDSLNATYGIKETRPWWKVRLTAILLTMLLSVLVITALALILNGGDIGKGIANGFGLGAAFEITWKVLQYPIVVGFILLALSLLYYFAPDLKNERWHYITPGAAVGVALWLLVSLGFRLYLHFFNSYSKTYGSLGAVIILMLWFYFTGLAVLIGGEMNSVIRDAQKKEKK
jgi:membrane protein